MRRPALAALAAFAALAVAVPTVTGQPGSKDWVDSPFTGQGDPPRGVVTTIYMSLFLDRIIHIDESRYTFEANFYFLLSWKDPRAQDAVHNATQASREPGASCARVCNGQKAPTRWSRCCSDLYLPTILFRNVEEFLQGRTQAYQIRIEPDDTVVWRSEVRAVLYFTGAYASFPTDVQSLDVSMNLQNNGTGGAGTVRVVPSASGVGLYAFGNGDDLSGWEVKNITIQVNERPWSTQFDDPKSRNLRTRSAPGDPAPIVPASPGAAGYGADLSVVQVRVGVVVERLSLYYSLTALVPIVLCVVIALMTHVIDPDLVETRLQIVVTLFLSLTALQLVFEGDLPKSSYILPTGQLVIASYAVMIISAAESIAVYNVHSWPAVRDYFAGMAAARAARADLRRARAAEGRPSRGPSLARSATRIISALTKGRRERYAPKAGARFARNAAGARGGDSDDEADAGEGGGAGGAGQLSASHAAARAAALTADVERSYFNWLAWVVDAVTLVTLTVIYALVAAGIFLTARARRMDALM